MLEHLISPRKRSESEVEAWLLATLRGKAGTLPPPGAPDRRIEAASKQGVDALVASQITDIADGYWQEQRIWRQHLTGCVAEDAARHRELQRLVDAWSTAELAPLLLKGSGLAYTHYPSPWLRPQSDVDVWCADRDANAMRACLERSGYRAVLEWNNDGKHQFQYVRTDSCGVDRLVEVHLRLANPAVFASALTFAEAYVTAVAVPQVAGALTLSPPHALFLACVHRAAHHFGSRRLIWLYDIHLLARALSAGEWLTYVALASASQTRTVCLDGLTVTAAAFGTAVPPAVYAALAMPAAESSAAFLHEIREVDVRWSNLRATHRWGDRLALISAWLAPSRAYMVRRYGVRHTALLPLWYVFRVVARIPHWFPRYRNGAP